MHRAGHHTCQAGGLLLALHMGPEPDSVQQMPQSDPWGRDRAVSASTGAPETRYCLSSQTGPEGRRLSCVWLESCPVGGGTQETQCPVPPHCCAVLALSSGPPALHLAAGCWGQYGPGLSSRVLSCPLWDRRCGRVFGAPAQSCESADQAPSIGPGGRAA